MEPKDILKQHKLKRTGCREGILNILLSGNQAYSENEIKDMLGLAYDRTTFYRSLKILTDKGIIHSIATEKPGLKYALNLAGDQPQKHLHFYCMECNNVQCLHTNMGVELNLPEGFTATETELIVKGTCPNCKAR